MFADFAWKTGLGLSLAVLVYHHIGYPLLLRRLAAARRRQAEPTGAAASGAALPPVRVIVPAHNEAAVIARKIENLAALDYPRQLLDIVLVLDGCTDATKSIAEERIAALPANHRLRVAEYQKNIGKIAVLNRQIAGARADEIVALTDASALLAPDALLRAAAYYADPAVGVVCGTYRLAEAGSEGERAYTSYQTQLKDDEATLAAPMGAHGAFYTFRRAAWKPIPPDTINDDFMLPMSIVADGYRAIYDRGLVATELERTTASQEFSRRIRIGAGNTQQAVRLARLADPRRPWLAFVFLSGKGSRPFIPLIALLALVATTVLAWSGGNFFRILLVAEIAGIVLAVAGILGKDRALPKPIAWLAYLVEGHVASLLGAVRFLSGRRLSRWQPADSATQDPLP